MVEAPAGAGPGVVSARRADGTAAARPPGQGEALCFVGALGGLPRAWRKWLAPWTTVVRRVSPGGRADASIFHSRVNRGGELGEARYGCRRCQIGRRPV